MNNTQDFPDQIDWAMETHSLLPGDNHRPPDPQYMTTLHGIKNTPRSLHMRSVNHVNTRVKINAFTPKVLP